MTQAAVADLPESGVDDRVLVIERQFDAPPQDVFNAFTDPETLARWWGPEGLTAPVINIDAREGHDWLTVMRAPNGDEHTVSGVYKLIDPPGRLSFTWAWHTDGERGHETLVELFFEPAMDGTKLTLRQSTFQDTKTRDMHGEGWNSTFNDLIRVFE